MNVHCRVVSIDYIAFRFPWFLKNQKLPIARLLILGAELLLNN